MSNEPGPHRNKSSINDEGDWEPVKLRELPGAWFIVLGIWVIILGVIYAVLT